MWLLDLTGFICGLVLVLTAYRIFETGRRREISARVLVAVLLGFGGAWSMYLSMTSGHLHPAHVLVLLGINAWIVQAIWRHRHSPLHHPGRRRTDFGELDTLASKGRPES